MVGYALPVFIVAFNTLLQIRPPASDGRVPAAADVVLETPHATCRCCMLLVSVISFPDISWTCVAVILAAAAYLTVVLGRPGPSTTVESASDQDPRQGTPRFRG